MKTLFDLQKDVRDLEKHVKDISANIKTLNSDIEEMRNKDQDVAIDYRRIEILSKQIPFGTHPLKRLEDERVCRIYLEMLLNITRLDSELEATINRMVYLQWLKGQASIAWSFSDLYKNTLRSGATFYDELADEIPGKYREGFIVDAMITANIAGTANREIQEYIANIAVILGIQKERIRTLALVARTALCQSMRMLTQEEILTIQDVAKTFSYYIPKWIRDQGMKILRNVAVEMPDSEVYNFKWKAKQKQRVNAGDVIATWRKEKTGRGNAFTRYAEGATNEITAPVDGVLFQFRDNNTNYGVIAHESDNKDSIKAWIKEGRPV